METIVKVIKQQEFDRYVFATYSNGEIVGLNFHQGCNEILWEYKIPSLSLSDIYKRLVSKPHVTSEEDRINKAIDLYKNAFIFQDEYSHTIPTSQLSLIQKALKFYVEQCERFNSCPIASESNEIFDMNQLREMMNYSISITISEEDRKTFAFRHGMDFPEYNY